MIDPEIGAYVAIISARRPKSVEKMSVHFPLATYFVAEGETQEYSEAGALSVLEGGALCVARNMAMVEAERAGLPCLQVSDDLVRVKDARDGETMTAQQAGRYLVQEAQTHGAKFAGCAPTANRYFYNPKKPVQTHGFIVGDLCLVQAGLRWDERFRLKEDYDLTCHVLSTYGYVLRCNFILAEFKHRTNPGGAVAYRTSELEQEAIALLMSKYPGMTKPNKKRANEILLA
jgi:hypothetical protein